MSGNNLPCRRCGYDHHPMDDCGKDAGVVAADMLDNIILKNQKIGYVAGFASGVLISIIVGVFL